MIPLNNTASDAINAMKTNKYIFIDKRSKSVQLS